MTPTPPKPTTPPTTAHPLLLPSALSPDSIDTLTELASILAHVRYTDKDKATTTAAAAGGNDDKAATKDHAAAAAALATPAGPAAAAGTPGSGPSGGGTITMKEFPTATDNLKHKIQRARAQVKLLPDMQRTTAEQEAEIALLEARIARQREVLKTLKDIGARFAAEDSSNNANANANGRDVAMAGTG